MRLINIQAFLERERVLSKKRKVDRRTKVFEFGDDRATSYAILSHRWFDEEEVDYEEMVDLAKMDREERGEIRQRLGYKKILDSCEQAQKDGYAWLWVDTCCIDKRSSAELSEAINSMYRWYENSGVCYTYLHDVESNSYFPTFRDFKNYRKFNGYPEWFSRGWTLQELIAPKDVQFFNKDWQLIGDKKSLSTVLSEATQVPKYILTDGLSSNRPCVAQIMSWAATRQTTRIEDRAYSLMGLLGVNMPMLYGEGKKAFHRLQLEIIRSSNDQSIFAWDRNGAWAWTGCILADDPSFFADCSTMELMDHDEFLRSLKDRIPERELPLINQDHLGSFLITNRGIQIWMLLRPYEGSCSVFQTWLPCKRYPSDRPEVINLALWDSNYYRCSSSVLRGMPTEPAIQFRQVYLRYQGTSHHDITLAIDDSAVIDRGFTCLASKLPGNMLQLTAISPLCVRIYSDRQTNRRLSMAFGQYLGQDWLHFDWVSPGGFWSSDEQKLLVRASEHAKPMAKALSRDVSYGRACIKYTRLPQSTWIVRTVRVVWEKSSIGIWMDILPCHDFHGALDKWTNLDVKVSRFFGLNTHYFYDHFLAKQRSRS